jgi:hypothetical protein
VREGRAGRREGGEGGKEGGTYLLSLPLQALSQALLLSDLDLLHQQFQLAQLLHRSTGREGGREGGR